MPPDELRGDLLQLSPPAIIQGGEVEVEDAVQRSVFHIDHEVYSFIREYDDDKRRSDIAAVRDRQYC